ncbi:MAG TPA: hypothetical protein DCO68_01000 [Methylophilaceae bacterium]|nr:hypothetical protein [Methylophilaceae bacterium]HAJ70635.1 hypothetical protein [Methylophilaceae bacterium]
MNKFSLSIFSILVLCSYIGAYAADGKIVKWVDKDGVTHYGDKPPMPDTASKASMLNKQGMTVKKIEPAQHNPEADKVAAEQARRDAALLATYSTAEEIDFASARNTKIDELAVESLSLQLENQRKSLAQTNEKIAGFIKKKKTPPDTLVEDKQKSMADIASTEQQIAQRKKNIEATRLRYSEDKAHFIALKTRSDADQHTQLNSK